MLFYKPHPQIETENKLLLSRVATITDTKC